MLNQTLKLESVQTLIDGALDGKSWEELEEMHADLELAERRRLASVRVGDPAKCGAVRGQVEMSAREEAPESSFDDEGRYIATDEDIPF